MPLDRDELAAAYGWSVAFFNSDKSLKALFTRATRTNPPYSAARFAAELRNTTWYRNNSEAMRFYNIRRKTDPKTHQALSQQAFTKTRDMVQQLGGHMSTRSVNRLAAQALMFGWTDAQMRDQIAGTIRAHADRYWGEANENWNKIQSYATAMGLGVKPNDKWIQSIARGDTTVADYQQWIKEQTVKAFPLFKAEFDRGMTLQDVAAPYVEAMARTLELSPSAIDVFHPTLRRALAHQDPETGKPAIKPVTEFETELRKMPVWRQTKNAQDQVMTAGAQLLRHFGLAA